VVGGIELKRPDGRYLVSAPSTMSCVSNSSGVRAFASCQASLVGDHHEPDRRVFGMNRPVQGASVWVFGGFAQRVGDAADELLLARRNAQSPRPLDGSIRLADEVKPFEELTRRPSLPSTQRVVAIGKAIRLVRAQGREPSLHEDHAEVGWRCEDRRADLDLTVEAREAIERLGSLTARQIEIFSLQVAGMTYEEISVATGHSRRAVERHVTRARARLREARRA
jgi:DNA-binding CsgD family transcriptional regulator